MRWDQEFVVEKCFLRPPSLRNARMCCFFCFTSEIGRQWQTDCLAKQSKITEQQMAISVDEILRKSQPNNSPTNNPDKQQTKHYKRTTRDETRKTHTAKHMPDAERDPAPAPPLPGQNPGKSPEAEQLSRRDPLNIMRFTRIEGIRMERSMGGAKRWGTEWEKKKGGNGSVPPAHLFPNKAVKKFRTNVSTRTCSKDKSTVNGPKRKFLRWSSPT